MAFLNLSKKFLSCVASYLGLWLEVEDVFNNTAEMFNATSPKHIHLYQTYKSAVSLYFSTGLQKNYAFLIKKRVFLNHKHLDVIGIHEFPLMSLISFFLNKYFLSNLCFHITSLLLFLLPIISK